MDFSLLLLITLLNIAFFFVYTWAKGRRDFWKNQAVPHVESPLLLGNIFKAFFLKEHITTAFDRIYYSEGGRDKDYVGFNIFHKPAILVRSLDLVKQVMVKDFNYFSDHLATSDPHSDPLGYYNLFSVKNPHWRSMRTKLTPFFTSGKMKQMYQMVAKTGEELNQYLKDHYKEGQEVEIKEVCSLFTTDVIASIAYGVEANSMRDPNAEFRKYGRKIFDFSKWRPYEWNVFFFLPEFIGFLRFKMFSAEASEYMGNTLRYIMEEREKSGNRRNDLIDMLIDLKNADKGKTFTSEEVVFEGDFLLAQAMVFFTAGFETSSTTMSFAIYELCKHPEIQEKLRAEIRETIEKNNGQLSYDVIINQMPYLGQVIDEVLRLYPIVPFLDREVTSPPGESGYNLNNIVLPPKTPVIVPILSLHMDPKYWDKPKEFRPERFDPSHPEVQPYTYLPFGTGLEVQSAGSPHVLKAERSANKIGLTLFGTAAILEYGRQSITEITEINAFTSGPRECIGKRFGLMQVRIGLINILRSFKIEPSPQTLPEMQFFKAAVLVQPINGMNHVKLVLDELQPKS